MRNALDSTWTALTSGHPLSAGPSAQNGGEFMFQNGELKWCSRMVSYYHFFASSSFVCVRAMDDAICFRSDILT